MRSTRSPLRSADIYDFDETSFRVRIGRLQKIVTRDPKAKAYIESSTNPDFVTVIETISAERIWWCAYTLDRLCAAQEGTPFLINEGDCDVELLTEDDIMDSSSAPASMHDL